MFLRDRINGPRDATKTMCVAYIREDVAMPLCGSCVGRLLGKPGVPSVAAPSAPAGDADDGQGGVGANHGRML